MSPTPTPPLDIRIPFAFEWEFISSPSLLGMRVFYAVNNMILGQFFPAGRRCSQGFTWGGGGV